MEKLLCAATEEKLPPEFSEPLKKKDLNLSEFIVKPMPDLSTDLKPINLSN